MKGLETIEVKASQQDIDKAKQLNNEWREQAKKREDETRKLFEKNGIRAFRAGWLGNKESKAYYFEVKRKKRFVPPPFEGHGISHDELSERLAFQKNTGMRCLLVIFEFKTNDVFYQWLDVLNNGKCFDTKRGMRVYELTAFRKLESDKLILDDAVVEEKIVA